jgi:hypothetical protein
MKYRAWDTAAKRWRDEFDWVINPETGTPHYIHDNEFYQGEATQLVLCRFTGFFDKHNKEVFEQDIITLFNDSVEIEYKYRVVFEKGKFVLYHIGAALDFAWGGIWRPAELYWSMKVVGNTFENKL